MTQVRLARFAFRASVTTGGGHAMRCLALADALVEAGWRCEFLAGSEVPADIVATLKARHLVAATAANGQCDLLVFDGYDFEAPAETAARGDARRVLVIDDLADRAHAADILLDTNAGRRAEDYDGLLPPGARRLIGPAYAPIRPAFAACRPEALARRDASQEVRLVIVSCGLIDAADATGFFLRALDASGYAGRVVAVLGASAPHRDRAAAAIAAARFDGELVVAPTDLTQRLAQADIALGAAGVSALERCVVGLPSICIRTADNQDAGARHLAAAGAILDLGALGSVSAHAAGDAIGALLADPVRRRTTARAAARVCDGRGLARTVGVLSPEIARDGADVVLRPANIDDAGPMLAWQSEPGVRAHSRNTGVPAPEEHAAWLRGKLESPDSLLNVVEVGDIPCGVVRLDPSPEHGAAYEVSILLSRRVHGRGVGRAALRAARRLVRESDIVAEIAPANGASRTAFIAAGFRQDGVNWYRSPAAAGATMEISA